MAVIDADGHVEESVAMFDLLEPEWHARRPLALGLGKDTAYGQWNAVWLIDGVVYPRIVGTRNGVTFATPTIMDRAQAKAASIPAQELTDVSSRLRDLDACGIDQQVVFPTMFLATSTEDLELESALLRCYNTFVGRACQSSGGRIHYAALVPIRDVEASIAELQRARALGAVAVMLLGVAWDMSLDDARLRPFYEEAARLDMAVCLHFGWGSPAVTNAFDSRHSFNSATLPVLMGARAILGSGFLDEIPDLRVAFLESGSQWLPWMLHQLRRGGRGGEDPSRYFRRGQAFIACEADEDINYLVSCVGDDGLVVASDYPHADPSAEADLSSAIMARDDVPISVRQKILFSNPQRLYRL